LRRTPRDITDHPAVNLAKLTADQIEALRGATLRFDGGAPIQEVTRLHPPAGAPQYAVLSRPWTLRPTGNPIAFAIENVYEPARILSEPRSVNPELSWEYWDGTAWWTIKGLVDGTGHLLFSGKVTFCVPASLQPTDVVGRTSHWIRARLVGGDYGRESVAVTSVEVPKTDPVETRQTIDRSLDDIVAPQIVSINLYYSVCCAALPDFAIRATPTGLRMRRWRRSCRWLRPSSAQAAACHQPARRSPPLHRRPTRPRGRCIWASTRRSRATRSASSSWSTAAITMPPFRSK
jgi:hypothetical protein